MGKKVEQEQARGKHEKPEDEGSRDQETGSDASAQLCLTRRDELGYTSSDEGVLHNGTEEKQCCG